MYMLGKGNALGHVLASYLERASNNEGLVIAMKSEDMM